MEHWGLKFCLCVFYWFTGKARVIILFIMLTNQIAFKTYLYYFIYGILYTIYKKLLLCPLYKKDRYRSFRNNAYETVYRT